MEHMSDTRVPDLEIAVQDPEGARAAIANGADRVELCVGLGSTGGLTPSLGLFARRRADSTMTKTNWTS
jgi:copper homeostasis protein CutC